MATNNSNTKKKIMLGKNFEASDKFGDNQVEGAICLDTLQDEAVKKLAYEYQGKMYLNVKVVKYKETTEHGATHYIEVDQFVPKPKQGE